MLDKQKNKWGYLNNPEWSKTPTTMPVNYDGVESTEPQQWVPPDQGNHKRILTKVHHPCGHWHRPVTIAPPVCLGVDSVVYDPINGIIAGIGNGSGATTWEIIRVYDNTVMDSGLGNLALFSFIGSLGETYQLQFS
jgi:hypothetical protein